MNRDWILPGRTLTMELSSYCQARCKMCPFEVFPNKNKNMEFDLFVKCIDEGSAHGLECIDVCLMGDSLLDKGFSEKMDYVKGKYPWVKIYASSQGMSAEEELVCRYIDTLHISFYGITKDIYEGVHGGGVRFEKALSNVERILCHSREERPYVILTFLQLPENESQMEEWILKWEPLADEVIVWKPHNWAGIYATEKPKMDRYTEAKSCGRPINGPLCIWVNGDVTPCCFSWDEKMVIGNVYKESLEEIFFGERRKHIRAIHDCAGFLNCNLPCEKCDQIFNRDGALVYSNHDRKSGGAIYGEEQELRFMRD